MLLPADFWTLPRRYEKKGFPKASTFSNVRNHLLLPRNVCDKVPVAFCLNRRVPYPFMFFSWIPRVFRTLIFSIKVHASFGIDEPLRGNARIEGLVKRACSHASLSFELGLNVVICWEAWKRSCDVLIFASIWYIIVSLNKCRRDQETYQSYNFFIAMWYVKLVFICCATFYAATKTLGKFSITKGNQTGLQRENTAIFHA